MNIQNSVANILKIIKEFITEVRIEKALTIANLVTVILSGSKISLYQLGIATNCNHSKLKSCEQRIRRLLDQFPITAVIYAKAVLLLFNFSSSVELIIDRTNWMFGRTDINYLVLSLRWNDCLAIPIYWMMLDNKGGNSNSEQRIALVEWFITSFKHLEIINIYADREFPSVKFITWLLKNNINFIFRSKGSINASAGDKKVSLSKLYHGLANAIHNSKIERKISRIFGNRLYISARINNASEFMFLVSNQHHDDPFTLYARRWNIETMFGNFKTKSFDLESTHITQYHRLSALFMILAITYCFSCKMGYIANKIKPIKQKKLKDQNGNIVFRPEFTIFKYGFYLLKNFFNNFLSYSAVVAKQLYKILCYHFSPNYHRRSRIIQIILGF